MGKPVAVGFADKTNCTFYLGIVKGKDKCSILTECKDCLTCKFGKTEIEFKKSREEAEKLLLSKGLKMVKKTRAGGGEYITVESITTDIEKSIENGEIPLF